MKNIQYKDEDLSRPDFIGIFCMTCDQEIGYDDCPNCEEENN